MTQLEELKIINDANILYLKKINKNCQRNEVIKKILEDETCFFKMNKEDACLVLKEIGISEDELDSIYNKLASSDEYHRLIECNKINANDEEILIKYPTYNPDDIFKNKKRNDTQLNDEATNSIQNYKESFFTRLINTIKSIFSK